MTFLRATLFAVALAFWAVPSIAADTARIDSLLADAIGRRLVAGGVVLIGNSNKVLFLHAYGRVSDQANARPMTVDTIFDLASLTKVIATTPSILKLAEERRISLLDPVTKWFPEFQGHGKDKILVLNLLTHTSGLDDFPLSNEHAMQRAVQGAAEQRLKGEIGHRFKYADLNFILLAELVRRATGAPLDFYTHASFFGPLEMSDTSFNPREKQRCSSTVSEQGVLTGEAQDRLAQQLGGVAGHAGLFSTAADLAKFCRMMLSGGVLDGKRVLQQRSVDQMTAPYFSRGGDVVRGLGWDISSPYSAPRGGGFSRVSFGHTGYSGSSVWIDPQSDTFVILLTARVDYKHVHVFNQLRGQLSTLAAKIFGTPSELKEMGQFSDE